VLSAVHLPNSEANLFYGQGNQSRSFRPTGWSYIHRSLPGYALHHVEESPPTTFFPCYDFSMFQMHDHRGHSQTRHWVESRVSFPVLDREVRYNLLSDVFIPWVIERCEMIKLMIDIHDCASPPTETFNWNFFSELIFSRNSKKFSSLRSPVWLDPLQAG
jgi:hypothetical protein